MNKKVYIGKSIQVIRKFTLDDVKTFAQLSGDMNPLHLDEEYAKTTQFKGRICHGNCILIRNVGWITLFSVTWDGVSWKYLYESKL